MTNHPKASLYILMCSLFLVSFASCSRQESPAQKAVVLEEKIPEPQVLEPELPIFAGEVVQYTIKNLGVKAGEAVLSFDGFVSLEGKQLFAMTFLAQGFNFFDEEKIFADPQTFYPVMIKRNVNVFGKKEQIVEEYNQKEGFVRVTKVAGGQTTEQVLKKEGPIDNIYCFIYRYRSRGDFKLGDSLTMKLPTKDIKIDLVKNVRLGVAGKAFDAFYMQSEPAQYKLWFDQSEKKIPLRIDGALGLGKMSMMMRDYEMKPLKEKIVSPKVQENQNNVTR